MKKSPMILTEEQTLFLMDEFSLLYELDVLQIIQVRSEAINHKLRSSPDNEFLVNVLSYQTHSLMYDIHRTNLDLIAISLCLENFPEFAGSFFESLLSLYDPRDTRPHFTPMSVPHFETGTRGVEGPIPFDLRSFQQEPMEFIDPQDFRLALVHDKCVKEFREVGYIMHLITN